jgi:hypothetical protein
MGNRVLRGILTNRKDELTGGWERLHDEEISNCKRVLHQMQLG